MYGGSVKLDNLESFLSQSHIDGALVGSESLIAKDFNKMRDCALKEIELNPKGYEGYYNAGLAYFNLNAYPEAISYLEKATEHNPSYGPSYCYLGLIYR